jgi:hypothetical protein
MTKCSLARMHTGPKALATEIFQQFPCFANLVAQHGAPLKRFLREAAVLDGIAVALRGTGPFCPSMHAAAFLSRDGRCPAASPFARFRPAPRAIEHRPPIAGVRTGHLVLIS